MDMGYCRLHNERINWDQFTWKGCWTCQKYFEAAEDWISADEAAKRYNVSIKTIYRWIKKSKLNGVLAVMGRKNANLPKKLWIIYKM